MDSTLLHHDDLVANRQEAVQIMGADDQGQAATAQLLYHFEQCLRCLRVQPCGRLIQNQKPGLYGQGTRNTYAPLLAPAKQKGERPANSS